MKIRRDDIVVAVSGRQAVKDKSGKPITGKVLRVFPDRGTALVEGFNLVKRHLRKGPKTPQGGIVEKEAPLRLCKLMLYCPECKKGVRAVIRRSAEGRVRACRRCGHAFDAS